MRKASRPTRWWKVAIGVGVALFGAISVMTWPRLFVSEGRELTGTGIALREIVRFDLLTREGPAAVVYGISDSDADALSGDLQSLRTYPMWSALAFDGYKRVRWKTVAQLRSGPDATMANVFAHHAADPIDAAGVKTIDEVHQLASWLATQDDVLVCGWYSELNGTVTNYFVYVLDLKRRIMVKVSMIT